MKIAIVRGTFLAEYECQIFYPLVGKHKITAFSSLYPYHDRFPFMVAKLPSPMDIPFGPLGRFKMPILNRLFIDAHLLLGLESKLEGYDIAHTADSFYHYSHQCINARRSGLVKGVVANVYENIPFNNESIWGRRRFKEDVLKFADHFIAISERSKATLLLEGVGENRITVINQHIDTRRFAPRNNTNRHSKSLTILFAGRLEFYKGVFEIIYSAKRLLSDPELSGYDLHFILVGNGSARAQLLELASRLGISGKIEIYSVPYGQMPLIYHKADIFVAPSRATRTYQEQFCTVLLEAQASGLPIVTTASGGIPENVGNAALIANPGDFYSISEALKRFILSANLRKAYSRKARNQAVTKFDIRLGARKLEEVYEKVLKGK